MNTALWQAGWGYFLSNMIGTEAGLTRPTSSGRRHFLDHVRSFGPLPAFRCGAQPYGLLPVTSLDLWQPGPDAQTQDTWLKGMLVALRDTVWRPAAASVARIGNRRASPRIRMPDLADVMRTDASRAAIAPATSSAGISCSICSDSSARAWRRTAIRRRSALLQQLGIPWRPRLSRMWNADWHRTLFSSLVQPGEVSPWRSSSPTSFPGSSPSQTSSSSFSPGRILKRRSAMPSLLQMLLRHALLREIAYPRPHGSRPTRPAPTRRPAPRRRARGSRDRRAADQSLAASARRTLTVTGGGPSASISDQTTFTTPALAALGEFRSSLADLKNLDSEASRS